jgi:hypothetical protein
MMSLFGGAVSAPVVLGQLFPDVGGFLFTTEFLRPLASLVSALLTTLITSIFGGVFGFTM